MKTGTTTLAGLVLISLVFSASHLYADKYTIIYPRNPNVAHVTELLADTPKCVSTEPYSTWSYNVTWKATFNTWKKVKVGEPVPVIEAPRIWTHYEVHTPGCKSSKVVVCEAMCQAIVSGCSWKTLKPVTKVAVYDTEEEKGSFGMSTIGGMLRPPMKKVVTKEEGTTVVCGK